MTQIELGKIMVEAQKVADVKDARVSKRTGVSEVVFVGLKEGIVCDNESAVKVMAYLLEVIKTSKNFNINKKQKRHIPHKEKLAELKECKGSIDEYAEVLTYICSNIHFFIRKKESPKINKVKTSEVSVISGKNVFSSNKEWKKAHKDRTLALAENTDKRESRRRRLAKEKKEELGKWAHETFMEMVDDGVALPVTKDFIIKVIWMSTPAELEMCKSSSNPRQSLIELSDRKNKQFIKNTTKRSGQ